MCSGRSRANNCVLRYYPHHAYTPSMRKKGRDDKGERASVISFFNVIPFVLNSSLGFESSKWQATGAPKEAPQSENRMPMKNDGALIV